MRRRLRTALLVMTMVPLAAGWAVAATPSVAGAQTCTYNCGGGPPSPNGQSKTATLGASATEVPKGGKVTFTAAPGTFAPNVSLTISLKLDTASGDSTVLSTGTSANDGSFSVTLTMPAASGIYYIEITGLASDGTQVTALVPINVDGEGNVVIGPAALTRPAAGHPQSAAPAARQMAVVPSSGAAGTADRAVPASNGAASIGALGGAPGSSGSRAQAAGPLVPHRSGSNRSETPVAIAVVIAVVLGLAALGAKARRLRHAD